MRITEDITTDPAAALPEDHLSDRRPEIMARDNDWETAPSSLETEEALLGAVLQNPESALPDALKIGLKPGDFFKEAHAEIFRACLKLDEDRHPVDPVTVAEVLKRRGTLEKCGGPTYLAKLYDGIGLAACAAQYARIIIDQAILRRLKSTLKSIWALTQRCHGLPPDAEDLLDRAESEILKIRGERYADKFIDAAEGMKKMFSDIMKLQDGRCRGLGLTGLPSGYDALDKLTGGFQKSDLIILAAQPGLGKTALALNLALNAAVPSRRQTFRNLPPATVAFFSLEKNQKQLLFRLVCQLGHYNLNDLRTGRISEQNIARLGDTINCLGEAKIYIDDTPALKVWELRAKARRLQGWLRSQGLGLDLVVVDCLQLIRGSDRRAGESREEELSEISRSLKNLAKELDLPILVLSKFFKDRRYGKDKKPRLSDFPESRAMEQYADLIAFIHSPDEYLELGQDRRVELLIRKHRNGPTGEVPLYFNAASATFLPFDTSEQE